MDKSKLMMIIIISLLVLLLGTVVGVTFYLINLVGDGAPEDFHVVDEQAPPPNIGFMDLVEVPLGRITTNLAIGERGTSDTVMLEVILGVNNTVDQSEIDEFVEQMNDRIGFARGQVNTVFGGLTYEEVRTPEGQKAAQEEITSRLQAAFQTNLIIDVQFSEWFAQRGR